MKEFVTAVAVAAAAGIIANLVGDLDLGDISNGDLISIAQLVLLVYLVGEVRHLKDSQPPAKRSRWIAWLPKW